ncbi:MAG: hypothetical protein ACK55Z_24620, partial [bacterium]
YGQLLLVLLLKRLLGRQDRVVLGREVVKRHARAGRSAPPRRQLATLHVIPALELRKRIIAAGVPMLNPYNKIHATPDAPAAP